MHYKKFSISFQTDLFDWQQTANYLHKLYRNGNNANFACFEKTILVQLENRNDSYWIPQSFGSRLIFWTNFTLLSNL